jgi:hypothetical protein
MRKPLAVWLAALVIGLAAFVGSGLTAAASEEVEAHAKLVPVPTEFQANQPLTKVTGRIELQQTVIDGAQALVVDGRARNMDPEDTYVSLLYTTPATGPTACQPGPPLSFTQMFLGTWKVDKHGRGELHSIKTAAGNTSPTPASFQAFLSAFGVSPSNLSGPGSFVPLTPIITSVSIREMRLVSNPVLPPGVMLPPGVQVPERIDCGALRFEHED